MTTNRPARFTFQLLQLNTHGVTGNVLLLHDKHQHVLVCPKQVHTSCLGGYCKYQAFYKQCSSLSKPVVLTDQHPELQQLIHLAGMSNTVSQVSLVKLTVCCQAMAKPSLQVPPQLLAGFQQLKDKSAQQTVVTTQHNSQPAEVQMRRPFPVSLPACQVPTSSFGQRYGLNTIKTRHLLNTAPLAQQLQALQSYYTTTIRLDRPGHYFKHRTWLNIHTQCTLFLGYCLAYHQKAQPNLESFLDPSLIAHFVSYHVAAKHTPSTISGFLFAAKKVIQWWSSTPGDQHDSFREGFAWLKALHTQVQHLQASTELLHCHLKQQHLQHCSTSASLHRIAAV